MQNSENGYGIMEKMLPDTEIKICYEGKKIVPKINTENGKIELSEKWQWLNGDESTGESVIVEC